MLRGLTRQDRNILNLEIDTGFQGITAAGAAVYISIYLVHIGGTPLDVALLTSLPALLMILLAVPTAVYIQQQTNLMQTVSRVRFIYYLAPLAVALLLFVPLGQAALPIILVWTVFNAVFVAFPPAWMALMPHIVPSHRMLAVTGDRWAIQGAIMAVAAVGYGLLLDHILFPINYQFVFFSSFVGGVVALYFLHRIRVTVPTTPVTGAGVSERLREMGQAVFSSGDFTRFLIAAFVFQMALWLPEGVYSIFWVRDLGASDTWIGIRTMAFNIALMLGYLGWGRVTGKIGRGRVLILCVGALALYPLLTVLSPSPFWLAPVAALKGLFYAGVDIVLFEALIAKSPLQHRPGFIATSNMLDNTARLLAPLLGAGLASLWDIRGSILAGAVLFVAASVLFRNVQFVPTAMPVALAAE